MARTSSTSLVSRIRHACNSERFMKLRREAAHDSMSSPQARHPSSARPWPGAVPPAPQAATAAPPDTFAMPGADLSIVITHQGRSYRWEVLRFDCIARSAYFGAMLGGAFVESGQKEIVLEDVDPGVVGVAMRFMYGQDAPMQLSQVVGVWALASRWAMLELQAVCERRLDAEARAPTLAGLLKDAFATEGADPIRWRLLQTARALGLKAAHVGVDAKSPAWAANAQDEGIDDSITRGGCRPMAGHLWAYHVDVVWFEPKLLANIAQGASDVFDCGPFKAHIKRIVVENGSAVPSPGGLTPYNAAMLAYELRLQVANPAFPTEKVRLLKGQAICANEVAMRYTIDGTEPTLGQAPKISANHWKSSSSDQECSLYVPYGGGAVLKRYLDDERDLYDAGTIEHPQAALYAGQHYASGSIKRGFGQVAPTYTSIGIHNVNLLNQDVFADRGVLRSDGHQYIHLKGVLHIATQDEASMSDELSCGAQVYALAWVS